MESRRFPVIAMTCGSNSICVRIVDDYICFLREVPCRLDDEDEDSTPPISFSLRDASKLDKIDVGMPLFQYEHRKYNIEAFVPKKEDQVKLNRAEQSWLLVEIPTSPDYPEYAWAALRPPRKVPWEKHAQERSDGYFSPAGWKPRYPEPSKWYKRRPGSDFTNCPGHPCRCLRLRLLLRLSDALTRAALHRTQDWFFIDLPITGDGTSADTVGDLLMFIAELVGNDRLRPGHLAISAGSPNERLWQSKTPLLVLWNHLHIASLKLTGEVTAFVSLNSTEHTSTLGRAADAAKEEGEYFAMAAVHSLPEWVTSDEHNELREKYTNCPCRLPHEELLKELWTGEQKQVTCGALQTSRRRNNRTNQTGSASSSANTSKMADVQSGRSKKVTFQ